MNNNCHFPSFLSVSATVIMSPMNTLLVFSVFMMIFPLVTFFTLRNLLTSFVEEQQTASIGAAIGAVLAVHTIVFLFVYRAYHEKDDEPVDKEKDAQKID